mgnify:FL=1
MVNDVLFSIACQFIHLVRLSLHVAERRWEIVDVYYSFGSLEQSFAKRMPKVRVEMREQTICQRQMTY